MTLENFLTQNTKKYLIFDFDETLVYLKLPWHLWSKGIKAIGYDYDHGFVESFPGWADELANELIKEYGDEIKEKIDRFSMEFEVNYLKGYEENPGLINFIRTSANIYKIYIWSSNCSTTIEPILEELNLMQYFEKIVTRDRVSLTKPYSDGFDSIYNGDNKNSYLMIGDSVNNDGGGARNAGIDYFRVEYF